MDDDELMNTGEVAVLTRLPEGTIRYLRYEGRGPRGVKLGRRVMYRKSDVIAWIDSQLDPAKGDAR